MLISDAEFAPFDGWNRCPNSWTIENYGETGLESEKYGAIDPDAGNYEEKYLDLENYGEIDSKNYGRLDTDAKTNEEIDLISIFL